MVSFTYITRRFRVHDYVIETWMEEGLIPQCVWRNGRRYWSSDEINALIAGCPVTSLSRQHHPLGSFHAVLLCSIISLVLLPWS